MPPDGQGSSYEYLLNVIIITTVFRANRVSFAAAHRGSQPAGQIRASGYDRLKMGEAHDHDSKHRTQEQGQKFYVLQQYM